MFLQHLANIIGGTMEVDWQMEHLKVSYKILRSPIGTLMLLVTVNIFSRLSLTSLSTDDMLDRLTYSAVRFLLAKGVISSSSELEEEMLITLDVRFFSFKSESLTAESFLLPKFQSYKHDYVMTQVKRNGSFGCTRARSKEQTTT